METKLQDNLAFTVPQFSKAAGISKPIVYELVHSEGFPSLRVGRKWLIPRQKAEEWLNENVGKQILPEA